MKVKYKKRLLDKLVKSSENPADFIRYVMALQGMSVESVSKDAKISRAHLYVILSHLKLGHSIGVGNCVKVAKGLDIDPKILYRVISDYNVDIYLNKENDGIYKND